MISQTDEENDGGDNDDGENHEDEETSAAKEAPESYFLTPQRPATWTAESPWRLERVDVEPRAVVQASRGRSTDTRVRPMVWLLGRCVIERTGAAEG